MSVRRKPVDNKNSMMTTYSGLEFDPMCMTQKDVRIGDISHALSLLCRGGGHLKYFYSVGQHCINCAREAKARGWEDRTAFACLLHDASEAYISDIIRPVKVHLVNYLEIENRIMSVVFKKFGLNHLTALEKSRVKQIDDQILEHELVNLMKGCSGRKLPEIASKPDFSLKSHEEIEKMFIEMARHFNPELRRESS